VCVINGAKSNLVLPKVALQLCRHYWLLFSLFLFVVAFLLLIYRDTLQLLQRLANKTPDFICSL
jgi:hypothetical protein